MKILLSNKLDALTKKKYIEKYGKYFNIVELGDNYEIKRIIKKTTKNK